MPRCRKGAKYKVVVGNIGTVFTGKSCKKARDTFYDYILESERFVGRAGGEDVTLFADDDVLDEHMGKISREGD